MGEGCGVQLDRPCTFEQPYLSALVSLSLWSSPLNLCQDYIVPKSCKTDMFGPRARTTVPTGVKSYEKVYSIRTGISRQVFQKGCDLRCPKLTFARLYAAVFGDFTWPNITVAL